MFTEGGATADEDETAHDEVADEAGVRVDGLLSAASCCLIPPPEQILYKHVN